ncbi:MAG TPA: methionyl-tRNA formyltransferase, partial [Cyclobacteriaceae bacterium]|nr:methionyl-tRNA formyltransferase [Cyclobacteriaceae bacterium]
MTDFRIVFMGTPEFALPSLEILMNHGYKVVGVVTSADKPRGRGKQIAASAVKRYALDHGLNILQPVNLKDEGFVRELNLLAPDLQVVVAFRKLPEIVWKIPLSGTINLHASLLPDYRGAAPINRAIINGETMTGVTTFFINQEIDKGKIILREKEKIYPDDDAGSLHDRLMRKGAELVLKTVELIRDGKVNPIEQVSIGILN